MLTPIILSGFLAKRFGKHFDLDVRSPREAVRALCLQISGFERALLDHQPGFRVWADKDLLDDENLSRCTSGRAIRIVPVVAGAKSGLGMIVLGAALMWAGPVAAAMWAPQGYGAAVAAGLSGIGSSLIIGGVSQLLFHPPKPPAAANNGQNYLFNGAVNTTAQGNCVPVCYGRMRVGSQMISAGIVPNQLPSTAVANVPGSGSGWNPTLTNVVG